MAAALRVRTSRVETEFEMKARLNRIKLRDIVLFVVVTSVVAVTTVCGAQEIGLDGDRAGARTDFEPGPAGSVPTESGRRARGAADLDPGSKREL